MSPSPRLLILGGIITVLAVIPSLWPVWLAAWLVLPVLLLLAVVFDIWQLSRVQLDGQRNVRRVIAHREWTPVALTIENKQRKSLTLKVHDMHPSHCRTNGLPQTLILAPEQSATLSYEINSDSRGDLSFEGIDCRVASKLSLWHRKTIINANDQVKVFPNFKANRLFGKLLSKRNLDNLGIRRLPRPGEGSDFNQLREYRDGDSLRQIDWKATARMQKLIAREYTQERDQQIVFLLDCSVRMRHQDQHSSHMDDTINAVVLLANVALQQGDSTGIMTFGGIDRWIAPAKGTHAARKLMQSLYDIEATQQLPDYVQAVETLAQRLKRRALIILITNLRNEDGDSALNALQRLRSKHIVLLADLREIDLDDVASTEPEDSEEAVMWFSAEGYRQTRQQQHKLAVANGTRLLDVTPADLSADLISRYLAIKRLGQL